MSVKYNMSFYINRQLDASRAELQRLEEVSRSLDQQVSVMLVSMYL